VCKEHKDLSCFYNRAASEDGKAYRCKVCDNAAGKAYKTKHQIRQRRKQRENNWRHKYKLERSDIEVLWEAQQGSWAICSIKLTNIEIDGNSLNQGNTCCIDHCHVTGKVRGLLCAKCNKSLGLFYDKAEVVYSAYMYLKNSEIH
jgi:hypothetical protein